MKTPDDFVEKSVRKDLSRLPVKRINTNEENKVVYACRFEPVDWDEGKTFHDCGAVAYEMYVMCQGQKIAEMNCRVEQCKCGGHSFAPHGAPAWLFPDGAMFDISWGDIAEGCRVRMLRLLSAMTAKRAVTFSVTASSDAVSEIKRIVETNETDLDDCVILVSAAGEPAAGCRVAMGWEFRSGIADRNVIERPVDGITFAIDQALTVTNRGLTLDVGEQGGKRGFAAKLLPW